MQLTMLKKQLVRVQQCLLLACRKAATLERRNFGVVLLDYNTAEIKELPVPEVKGFEVLVRMAYVQIGRKDLQVSTIGTLRGKDVLSSHTNKDVVLGSLGTGTVEQIGPLVHGDIEPGDRVVLEPRVHCGHCQACQERSFYMCKNLTHVGIPPHNGMLQNYFTHPWHLCHKLPPQVGLREGSYCSTFACCLQAYNDSGANPDSRVVVIGGGMAGACLVKIFSSMGVKRIVVIDVFTGVLGRMKKLGADFIINTKVTFPPVAVVDEIVKYCNQGRKANIVLDTVQSWATARTAAEVVGIQGTIVLFDQPSNPSSFNYIRYISNQNKLINIIELDSYGNEFKNAIHFIKNHQNFIEHISPYELPLKKGIEALTVARSRLSNKPCVIISCDPNHT